MISDLVRRVRAQIARVGRVPYEIRVRFAVGVLFIFVLASTLNTIRFISASRESQASEWSYRSAKSLQMIAEFLHTATREKLSSTRLRELSRLAGLSEVTIVETGLLRSEQEPVSAIIAAARLRELRELYSREKEVIGRLVAGPPALATRPYYTRGAWRRALFQPFVNEAGETYTLTAQTSSELAASLDEFWWLTIIFEGLSLLATAAVAVLLLQITFAPYRRIRKEAIAAAVAQPDNNESVDFAVDTFRKVIADLKVKERRLQRLYAQQRERAANLERYNDYILESMPSGVISCSVSGELTQVNRAATRLLHLSRSESVGWQYRKGLAELPQLVQLFDAALQTGEEIALKETGLSVRPGETTAVSIVCRLLHDPSDGVRGAMILINDLTKIKHLEEEISWREQMAALGEMSAGLAHQLRNSLGAMVGFGQLLRKLTSGGGQSEQLASSILREAEQTEKMLRQFLSYSSPGEIKVTEITLGDLLADLNDLLAAELADSKVRLTIEANAEAELPLVTDPLLLSHTLQNLIQNGIDACSGRGGLVRVTSSVDRETDLLSIIVRDNGKGIEPEIREKIFHPFFTSGKATGTGLGLALARKWIIALGGEISCTSEPGQGATFELTLPLSHQANNSSASNGREIEVAKAL